MGTKRVNRRNQTSKHQPTKGKIHNIVPLRLHVEPEKNQRLAQSANAFHLLTTETPTLESVADGLIPPEAAKSAILLRNETPESRSIPPDIHIGSEWLKFRVSRARRWGFDPQRPQTKEILPPPPQNPSRKSNSTRKFDPKSHPVTFLIPKRKRRPRGRQKTWYSVLATRYSQLGTRSSKLATSAPASSPTPAHNHPRSRTQS